ncbi:MAG: hypothetical protein JNL70_12065 [Saprospiraceae bacterium]|nr:hypothetical protein [Saprospiraceae bacterium]
MKSLFQKFWLLIAFFVLLTIGTAFTLHKTDAPACVVVDDISGMIDGNNNDQHERHKLPPKIKIPKDTLCLTGRTIQKSSTIVVTIKNGNGNVVATGTKNIPHNPNAGYIFKMPISPQLSLNVWYNIEVKFTHTDNQNIVQTGQIMRTTP